MANCSSERHQFAAVLQSLKCFTNWLHWRLGRIEKPNFKQYMTKEQLCIRILNILVRDTVVKDRDKGFNAKEITLDYIYIYIYIGIVPLAGDKSLEFFNN